MGPRCLYSTGYLNKLMILLAYHERNVLYHQLIVICRWCGYSFWNIWNHDDVIKWKCFLRYWPFVRGIHRSPVNSPHKHHWRGPLMLSLICAWINRWVNNREAGDLRHHCAHYDVIVMNDAHVLRRVTRPALGTVVEWKRQCMMTSSNGNIFRANGHLRKGQWRGALMFSLICVWINDWVNNREAGDLRRYRARLDVTVMAFQIYNASACNAKETYEENTNYLTEVHLLWLVFVVDLCHLYPNALECGTFRDTASWFSLRWQIDASDAVSWDGFKCWYTVFL